MQCATTERLIPGAYDIPSDPLQGIGMTCASNGTKNVGVSKLPATVRVILPIGFLFKICWTTLAVAQRS